MMLAMASSPQTPKPGLAAAILVPLFLWLVTSGIGVALIVAGVAKVPGAIDDLDRARVGEETQLDLDAGDYRVFIEGNGVTDAFASPSADVTISGPDGPVSLSPYGANTTLEYAFNNHEGTAAYTFTAPSSGQYTVSVASSDPSVQGIALGAQNPLTVGIPLVVIGVIVGTVGFLVALIVLIVLLVKRGRSKKRIFQAQAAAYQPGGGYQPGYPQGPWGPGQQ